MLAPPSPSSSVSHFVWRDPPAFQHIPRGSFSGALHLEKLPLGLAGGGSSGSSNIARWVRAASSLGCRGREWQWRDGEGGGPAGGVLDGATCWVFLSLGSLPHQSSPLPGCGTAQMARSFGDTVHDRPLKASQVVDAVRQQVTVIDPVSPSPAVRFHFPFCPDGEIRSRFFLFSSSASSTVCLSPPSGPEWPADDSIVVGTIPYLRCATPH
ncbi:hypothetical protein QBC34DRAFT_390857 [Podospora aff. communis PSN243]|uniref:Uncharacterized protein n=1 Tax=Podospora aff. communis PSN243 TaxID=3040156 RepID=A0AAV9H4Y4_9PEZI|nr:hypothetical protein QBC34DRAFT_390857 [Podospora aff. communis PSN243]